MSLSRLGKQQPRTRTTTTSHHQQPQLVTRLVARTVLPPPTPAPSRINVVGFCASGMCTTGGGGDPTPLSPTTTTTTSPTLAPTINEEEALRREAITIFVNNITYSAQDIVYPIVVTAPSASSSVSTAAVAASPEQKALAWVIEKDPLRLVPDNDAMRFRLTQRYALLTLWFQTDQSSTTSEFAWRNAAGWTTAENECVWAGVTCDNDNVVTEIALKDNNLHGRIPPDIGLLDRVHFLSLDDNKLTGPLPTSIGRMSRMSSFWLDDNRLTGTIPTQVGLWGAAMGSFWLEGNSITGTLPTEIGAWVSITEFYVHENALSGTIPTEIGRWQEIYRFTVQVNKFRGTLPTEIGRWSPGPYYFNVRGNQMTGTVPSSIGVNWTEIETARFENNRFAGGNIALCRNITTTLTADCLEVNCSCCSGCCPGLTTC
jgi:hypothetical protein